LDSIRAGNVQKLVICRIAPFSTPQGVSSTFKSSRIHKVCMVSLNTVLRITLAFKLFSVKFASTGGEDSLAFDSRFIIVNGFIVDDLFILTI
jgi:hypothetical protein